MNISAFPVSKTRNGNDHEFVFEFKYEGYSNYTVEFAFKTGGYSYSNRITQEVEFKTASNIIDLKKVGEDFGQDSYLIYDWYNASLGTKFAIATNKSDEIKNATISLDVSEAVGKINVLDINGNLKTLEEGTNTIFFNNNEVFYISAINGNAGSVNVDVKVSYEFENVLFETKKSITFKLMVSPKSFEFLLFLNETY